MLISNLLRKKVNITTIETKIACATTLRTIFPKELLCAQRVALHIIMSASALDGASKYLNNLLLARGFLQDGKAINFVQLASTEHTKVEECDNNTTAATVINLIHDLILRRDRDAEQREALSSTIRALRAEESQRILDLQRLQDRNIQLKTELTSSEAQHRTTSVNLKKALGENKELKEQAIKVKSTLDQTRAIAISDIRKRDMELDKLKNHLSGVNRGKKEPVVKPKCNTMNNHKLIVRNASGGYENGAPKEWSLESEDNDFLAAVVNETTTENVALRKIVGDSLAYLKTLTGLDEHAQEKAAAPDLTSMDNAIGIPGQYRDREKDLYNSTDSAQSDSIVPVQSLASSMSQVLAHCQTILRDPSFVPIEEVQVRDEEIAKLRAGWEKMADRWKEAVTMMSQWRQKMMSDGQDHFSAEETARQHDFEMEEFSSIPVFSRSIALRPDGRPVLDPIQEEELTSMLIDHHSRIGNHSVISNEPEVASTTHDETLPEPDETGTPRQPRDQIYIHVNEENESDLDLSEHPAQQTIASPARRGITIHRPSEDSVPGMPLSQSNANAKKRKSPAASSSPRKRRSFSPSAVEPTPVPQSSTVNSSMTHDSTDPLHLESLTPDGSDDEAEEESEDIFALEKKSKIPRMTVAEKLAAIEAEASEATEVIRRRQATSYGPTDKRGKDRERAIKAKSGSTAADRSEKRGGGEKAKAANEKVGSQRQAEGPLRDQGKSDRVKKARDRRRSTLTPAELGSLMGR